MELLFFYQGGCVSCLRACFGARLLLQSYLNLSEGADCVGGHLRGDKECPFSGVTKSGRVWRKVLESDARNVCWGLWVGAGGLGCGWGWGLWVGLGAVGGSWWLGLWVGLGAVGGVGGCGWELVAWAVGGVGGCGWELVAWAVGGGGLVGRGLGWGLWVGAGGLGWGLWIRAWG